MAIFWSWRMTIATWSVVALLTSCVISKVDFDEDNEDWETPGLPANDFVFDNERVQGYIDNNNTDALNDYYFGNVSTTGGSNVNIQSASHTYYDTYNICKACKPVLINRNLNLTKFVNYWHITPLCIKVMTCSGCCSVPNHVCTPIRINPIPKTKITVYTRKRGFSNIAFSHVQVYEHLECGCRCMITARDCGVNMEFRPKDCSCNCISRPARCNRGMVWDKKTCSCVCKTDPTSCKSSTQIEMVFNATQCSCVKKSSKFSYAYKAATGSSFRDGSRSDIINNLQYNNILQTVKKTVKLYDIKYPKFHLEYIERIDLIEKSICKPKLVDVPLPIDKYDYAHYFPDVVEINQCSGSCIGHFSECTPTITKDIQFTVLRMDHRNQSLTRVTFNFTQHLQCGCQCSLNEENCNPLFGHIEPHNCECLCRKTGAGPMDAACVERDGAEYKPPTAYQLSYTTYRNITGKRHYRNHYVHGDIASVEACGLLCRGMVLSHCRAYEYHNNGNCLLFRDTELRVNKLYRNKNDRKLYVRRELRCRQDHRAQTYAHHGMRVYGGVEKRGVSSVDRCRAACVDEYSCLGVDFDRGNKKCYLNYKYQTLVPHSGIDHYKIIDRCINP